MQPRSTWVANRGRPITGRLDQSLSALTLKATDSRSRVREPSGSHIRSYQRHLPHQPEMMRREEARELRTCRAG